MPDLNKIFWEFHILSTRGGIFCLQKRLMMLTTSQAPGAWYLTTDKMPEEPSKVSFGMRGFFGGFRFFGFRA